ncbi:MAG: cell filamentation protein Fic [Betaproteobacteria bacterium HGW-Betaproteobacteria-7]|nr:MAG: cell filamentation protein Fic [Betaproteobacteria bacterium HGW-Betaproteobacteria-7]
MPKSVAPEKLERIAALVASQHDGMGLEALLRALPEPPPRRTLQRRLATLIDQGRIAARGEGRGLRYFAAHHYITGTAAVQHYAASPASSETYVPLSAESQALRTSVRAPRSQRRPVGYQLDFLAHYQPNASYYLPESLREQLHTLGKSSANEAPAGTFARGLAQRLLIDLSWASSQLEGNTYSRLDTERLIEFGQIADGKDALETQMILNHKAAIEYLLNDPACCVVAPSTLISLHALLSDGLMPDPLACGRLRRRAVDIGGSVYLPVALPQRLEELFTATLEIAAEIRDPLEQAFFLMVHIPYLQPFEDVNKRLSRLAANIPLLRHNLCPLSFVDIPQQAYIDGMIAIYELNRVELLRDVFVWAYERSCQQYTAVRQQLVPPDTLRLRYRKELAEVVRAVIHQGESVTETAIRQLMPASVASHDKQRFCELVRREFATLHEGNAVRFGLRPLEYAAWRADSTARKRDEAPTADD